MEKHDLITRALEAALDLAKTQSWSSLTLIEIAKHGDISMAELYNVADKDTLTDALEHWADGAMSAEAADMDDTPRERLFDVIMRRFEHMEPHRLAILTLMKARDRAPVRLANLLKARRGSARWALSCAGLDDGSQTVQTANILGTAWVIGKTETAWRKDDSGDFARTMATLDAELTSAEERLNRLRKLTGKKSRGEHQSHTTPENASEPEARPAETDPN